MPPTVAAMQVTANGAARQLPDGLTVEQVLTKLKLRPDSVAVERNGEAVARSEFPRLEVRDGDRLEIVRAVAGG